MSRKSLKGLMEASLENNSVDELAIGKRVGIENKRGTVKFIGLLNEVDGGKETWLGIDWDKSEYGKHNGSFKGKQYFQTRFPTSGSFVKAKNVECGKGFTSTLRERHSELYDEVNNDLGVNFVLKKSAASFEKVFVMSTISLPSHFVSFLERDFDRKFQRCTTLDLSNNLLHDWNKLFEILNGFPSLKMLDISFNIMTPLNDNHVGVQSNLEELVMNSCQLEHSKLLSIFNYFPHLESLRIMANDLTDLPKFPNSISLKRLFIGNNPICDFSKLWHLSSLENLETLSLHGCGIKSIKLPENVGFKRLQLLNLNENPLNDWESINELGKLPCLKNLRTSGLYAGERGCQSHEILVSKLRHLEILDGCTINPKERRECELFFLNRFYQEPLPEVHRADLERLAKLHDEQLQASTNDQLTNSSWLFKLEFGEHTIERSLSLNLTVRKLVTMASRIFNFEPSDVKVSIQIFEENYELLKWDSSNVLRAFDPPHGCIVKFI